MPSLKNVARRLSDRAFGTAFDRALTRAQREPRRSFLFYWNRGLGDVALGLVPLIARIRKQAPDARIAVITREDLKPAFELTDVDEIHVLPGLQREAQVDIAAACASLGLDYDEFGTIFRYLDPNRWLEGRRRDFPPSLRWDSRWDSYAERLLPVVDDRLVIGAHINTETARYYGYVKDWPTDAWQQLFARFGKSEGVHWVLFGHARQPSCDAGDVSDLRGKTGFLDFLSIIKNRCRLLVAPDSGVLTMAYYLNAPFALDIISLWSDPRQGVLRQGCASPNPLLRHIALCGEREDVRNLSVGEVETAVRASLAAARTPRR